MSTEPHINIQREVEQGQNTLLHGERGIRCQRLSRPSWSTVRVTSCTVSTRRAAVGWGVARVGCPVGACQGAPFGGQAAADPALQQGQHTPSDSAPPDQAGAMLLPRPLQRATPTLLWPQAAAAALREGLAALGHHACLSGRRSARWCIA